MSGDAGAELPLWYDALLAAHGHRGWWPGRSRIETILGAILAQNTAWTNVEKAMTALRRVGLFRLEALRRADEAELAAHVRPSGAFRQKARKVRAFLRTLDEVAGGSLDRMARIPTPELRSILLATWGIGPETADCILLYAFRRPVFVVDAYTRRVLDRHGLLPETASYADAQALFHRTLSERADLWEDYHAQIVRVGQTHCVRAAPRCDGCPLERFLTNKEKRKLKTGRRGTDVVSVSRKGLRV